MISEIPLGIKKPLLPAKPLGQTPSQSHSLPVFVHSNIHKIDLLSSTGKTLLATITQKAATAIADKRKIPVQSEQIEENLERVDEYAENTDKPDLTATIDPGVEPAKAFPPLPISLAKLNPITALGQFQVLGQSSRSTLQGLSLNFESLAEQKLEDFSLRDLENDQNPLPETNFSQLKLTRSQRENLALTLDSQPSSQSTQTSWSSLAELVGEDSPLPRDSRVIKDKDDAEIEGFMFTPEGFRPIYANPGKKWGDVPDLIEAETTTVSGTNQIPIETIQPSVKIATSSPSTEPELVSESNLRMLAQEIYKLVRQRLQIERERYRR
ncbi:MAG: hypothetical protein RID09_00140 [Coleofasciculus sp. G1-WW12-02]|uniref:hypothetical protein n=1 Tax=Coleofasciculus sp. G1-WW12-02 TaxID=3068483 RepID=UPI0032FC671D